MSCSPVAVASIPFPAQPMDGSSVRPLILTFTVHDSGVYQPRVLNSKYSMY